MSRDQKNALHEKIKDLALGINTEMFIGPDELDETDDADYFNHSCEPNAGIRGR